MIATPAHDGRVGVHFAFAVAQSIKLCAQHGINLCPVYWPGEAVIQLARNKLLQTAVELNADDLVFIDSDEGWEPQALLRLLQYPVDVVGLAVPKKRDAEGYNVRQVTFPVPVDIATGLLIVGGLGTGFLRLSRKAYAAAWDAAAAAEYRDHNGVSRMVFTLGIDSPTRDLVTEDMMLCRTLQGLGFRVHLDPSVTCTHTGAKTWTGDFAAFLRRMEAEKAGRSLPTMDGAA